MEKHIHTGCLFGWSGYFGLLDWLSVRFNWRILELSIYLQKYTNLSARDHFYESPSNFVVISFENGILCVFICVILFSIAFPFLSFLLAHFSFFNNFSSESRSFYQNMIKVGGCLFLQ